MLNSLEDQNEAEIIETTINTLYKQMETLAKKHEKSRKRHLRNKKQKTNPLKYSTNISFLEPSILEKTYAKREKKPMTEEDIFMAKRSSNFKNIYGYYCK